MLVDIVNEQVKYADVEIIIINKSYNTALLKTIDSNIKVHLINRKPGDLNPLKLIKINKLIYYNQPHVIHAHNHNIVNLIWPLHKATTCLTVHDTGISTTNLNKYDKLFAISEAVKKDISLRGGPETKVVYNGIKIDKVKQALNKPNNNLFKIVQISRLDFRKKGQNILLNAVSILKNERGYTNFSVDFIGEASNVEDKIFLDFLVKDLGIENCTNFLGPKDRSYIYENLTNYDLLIQPSYYEGFGLTIVEAMAAKVPVLISQIDGPMEVINSGKYGLFFKVGNYTECANKIEEVITKRIIIDKYFLDKSYSYCKENFNIEKTATNYLSLYKDV